VSTSDSVTYEWSGLTGLCSSCPTQTFQLLESGNVSLTVTNLEGCTETASVFLEGTKDKRVHIPNAMSPNNDGVNDRFFVWVSPFVSKLGPMRIFDRWGNMLWTGIEDQLRINAGWDGVVRGDVVQSGVYTYTLEVEYIDGDFRVYQGEIHVLY